MGEGASSTRKLVGLHNANLSCVATYQKNKIDKATEPKSNVSNVPIIIATNTQSLVRPWRASSAETVARLRRRFMLRMFGFHHASNRSPTKGINPPTK